MLKIEPLTMEFSSSVRLAANETGRQAEVNGPQTGATVCPEKSASSRLQSVLFLSDDDYFRSTVRAFLEHVGLLVRSCADAARVPELFFRRAGVDLLLIDVHSLGASGLRLAGELSGFYPDLPVIVIGAREVEKSAFAGMGRRGWKFLDKPVRLPELLGFIRKSLEPAKTQGAMQ